MKGVCLILALVACAFAHSTVDHEWEDFKSKFAKQYAGEEEARRHKIFLENKALITEHNKKFENGEVTFKLGVNKFADMLLEETSYLRGYKSFRKTPKGAEIFTPVKGTDYPDTVDWRDKGYVTGVKDQGQCGSCWSFSATGSLEGQNFAKTGELVSLSEQNLVDCVTDNNCNGGFMVAAYHWVIKNGGIDTEESYPYTAKNGVCQFDEATIGGHCSDFKVLTPGSEDDLQAAVATIGPISVAIDASFGTFQMYADGVYYEPRCSTTVLDHGVLAVGYGTLDGVDYWLVKNSWGTSWGEAGYIKMSRNKDNNCGIASEASFPYV